MMMTTKWGVTFIALSALVSCAGPMTPFGSLELTQLQTRNPASEESLLLSNDFRSSRAKIHFYPGRQRLHDQQLFTVIIEDPDELLPMSKIKVIYNNRDVTDSFLKRATIKLSDDNQKMKIVFDFLRLPAQRDHSIAIRYQRDSFTEATWSKFLPPYCLHQEASKIGNISAFNVDAQLLNYIEKETLAFNMNPNFLAGLIAQESAFNDKAVSSAKALGLTQITSLASKEISDVNKDWPHYEGIENLNYVELKRYVSSGQINSKNEWRLNHLQSIRGGLSYLKYVDNYWTAQIPLLKESLPQYQDFWEDLMLASYNSGPSRVKSALLKNGSHFLEDSELNEAKKYVNRVKSFCYTFSNKSEDL
ncbi:MAG: hypothetical protein COW00_13085 [Bdellovibrio sp. CG12_big_fil_rev_8_21_14_0_65_39_13]|nr:MAG: hypothetical protein COW78_11135 [Bdellovibrio sp. CG22_combo_CG10-13_8_21_14_all_39_27]PIQ58864.1 MAG: hypothetical protein COW00_13085 [Bdellovibrio sp. CG12_big_fil_rev_8_21_14_0_65_39_13]PIR35955.1 MAG: hypothetical protein COV37_05460 [Bdellovibrio sp. CG11_big_fil_rev_8_21_14_0_20_39_38]PJB54148.1 MAG: hypothetical protein CO099_03145 [Bdellovibrio sp. CG_4_9_14_3_um_filter_39_7]